MTDLIERLESAAEGSRELDAEIARTLSSEVESDDGDFWWGPYNEVPVRVPDFSTSLDAAMQLRDASKFPVLIIQDMGPVMGCGARIAVVDTSDGEMTPVTHDGTGATPALALCAAILRAWEMKDD